MAPSLSILIVDDQREVGEMLSIWLEAEGHTVVHCRSGVEAVQKVQFAPQAFDVVITDHYMPGSFSGLNLARVIRTKRIETEIVVISGKMTPELKEEYSPFSILGFLPKPIDGDELQALLHGVILA